MSVRSRLIFFWVFGIFISTAFSTPSVVAEEGRVTKGLQVLYTFEEGQGDTIQDRSGVGKPLNLKIEKPDKVHWGSGLLRIKSATKISSLAPAIKVITAVKRTGSLTIEAWIRPTKLQQKGPARIVSISGGSSQRNFTLGQDDSRYDVRLRTSKSSANGTPSTASPNQSVNMSLTHVVYSRDDSGKTHVFINGKRRTNKKVKGNVNKWNDKFQFVLGNETTNDRPWLGEFHLVAVYNRALPLVEVRKNFQAGADSTAKVLTKEELAAEKNRQHFETKVAPLLATSCLDCHDSATNKGKLDLSRKLPALAGGESGPAILAGKLDESLLWEQVNSGAMPPEGPELSDEDKNILKQWITAGAVWPTDFIDPVIYKLDEQASELWVQRLTIPEYIQTVQSAVGVDISQEAQKILPPDMRADGFSNTAYNLNVDLKHVEAYAQLAEIIVSRMGVLKFSSQFSKSRKLSTDATMRKFVARMGKRLLRGPLNEQEISTYSGIATTVASTGGDYQEAVSFIIEAMLQSPRFIYRIENQQGDGRAWPIDEYELASRMSYILWGGPPDEELMRAADEGLLHDPEQIEKQVVRMLQSPQAIERSSQFVIEWLDLNRLGHLSPSRNKFPQWDPALATDMREETLAYFKEVVWKQKRPLSELLNAQVTFATPKLAKHYGLKPTGTELSRYDLSKVSPRGGLLTQGSVLTVGGDDASMVTRGLFVLQDVLRGTVKAPPAGLDITPVPSEPGLSQRMIGEHRIANVSCGGCHVKFEPLAFGLEKFDGIGAFHNKDEHGNELLEEGEILFPGTATPVPFQTTAELMDLLAESPRVQETLTWKVTQFALGRPLIAADAPIIKQIHEKAQKEGGTYSSLITAIVMSDLVQLTRTEASLTETE